MLLRDNYRMQQLPKANSEVKMLHLSLLSWASCDLVQTIASSGTLLTRDAGNAEHMSIADSELVHHCARLIGINDYNFTCWQGTGEDPDTTGRGIHFMELLCLQESKHRQNQCSPQIRPSIFLLGKDHNTSSKDPTLLLAGATEAMQLFFTLLHLYLEEQPKACMASRARGTQPLISELSD